MSSESWKASCSTKFCYSIFCLITVLSSIFFTIFVVPFLCAPYDFLSWIFDFKYSKYPGLTLNLNENVDVVYLLAIVLLLTTTIAGICILFISCGDNGGCVCPNSTLGLYTVLAIVWGVMLLISSIIMLLHLLGNFHFYFYYKIDVIPTYHFQLSWKTFMNGWAGLLLLFPPILVLVCIIGIISIPFCLICDDSKKSKDIENSTN